MPRIRVPHSDITLQKGDVIDLNYKPISLLAVLHKILMKVISNVIGALANVYKDSTATLLLHKKSDRILIEKGVRQGDALASVLFSAYPEAFKRLEFEETGINGEYRSNLRFADDIVPCSNDGVELQNVIEDLNRESTEVGPNINTRKTNIMIIECVYT